MATAHFDIAHMGRDSTVDGPWNLITGRRAVVLSALVVTLIIGAGDLATGVELPFTILYMLPIALGTWFRSRSFGLGLSALATAIITFALIEEHLRPISIAWNAIGAIALFCVACWVIDRMRTYVEQERAECRMAVEQLRHAARLNVIGTLAAGVAHELGTPLNVITGCSEIIAEESNDERIRRRTSMILGQAQKISSIVRKLVDFGHRGDAIRDDVELRALASCTVEMLDSTARQRGSSLILDDGPTIHVEGKSSEIEQVLSNLILNALQAMEHGTVHVRVDTLDRDGQHLARLEVEDNASGIPTHVLPHIFDPFFTTKGVGEGTGLGLSVAFGIVRDHHGTIEVESEMGRGSRFTVILPRRD